MGSDGHEEGIKGVDPGCGLRRVGIRVGMKCENQTATLLRASSTDMR